MNDIDLDAVAPRWRLLARLVDLVFFTALILSITLVAWLLEGDRRTRFVDADAWQFAGWLHYAAFSVLLVGVTPGKRWQALTVVRVADGQPPHRGVALVRELLVILSGGLVALPLLLGSRRGVHDWVTGTAVVVDPAAIPSPARRLHVGGFDHPQHGDAS